MKKLLSILLMVAMGLGMVSCVSNTESDSVKAIRDAKAAELLALAELHKAQAEAETLLAKAEAALLEAEARYQAALAEGKEIENQKAKAILELEIETIKAELQAELNRLLAEIAKYKDDLREEIVTQLEFWFAELSDMSATLIAKQGLLAAARTAAENDISTIQQELEMLKTMNIYLEKMIAEFNKHIEANAVDYAQIYAEIAPIRAELTVLEGLIYNKEDELDEFDEDEMDDEVTDFNQDMFDMFRDALDLDSDDVMDYDEELVTFSYSQTPLVSTIPPTVYVNEYLMALITNNVEIDRAAWLQTVIEWIGNESDVMDIEASYWSNSDYARLKYWTERTNTYKSDFMQQVIDAQDAVWDADYLLQEANAMDPGPEKDAAVAAATSALEAAVKAMHVYTMIGADKAAWGSFTKFIAETYNPMQFVDNNYEVLIDPTSISVSTKYTLGGGSVYMYKEAFLYSMFEYLPQVVGMEKDELAYDQRRLNYYQTIMSDWQTVQDLIANFVAYMNDEVIAEYVKVAEELAALEEQYEAKYAEYEAKMRVLLTEDQEDMALVIQELKSAVEDMKARITTNNKYMEAFQEAGAGEIYLEYLVNEVNSLKQRIKNVNVIIDDLEAQLNALASTEGTQE